MSTPRIREAKHASRESGWITGTVALLAIVVFAISGSQILPAIVLGAKSGSLDPAQISGFLLNTALVLFAWRRSEQLKKTFLERDEARQHAYNLQYFDEVTGMFNRRRFNEQLRDACEKPRAAATLMLIDLDNFKKINDLYGHAVGDELLVLMSQRLARATPKGAECYRFGGDEFVVLVLGENLSMERAEEIAEDIRAALTQPVNIANTITAVGVSIGIATLPANGQKASALLKRADVALYEAKRLGRDRSVFFDAVMELLLAERTALQDEMRAGIARGEFVPHYQPIFDLHDGRVRGFEVLARWHHPSRGLLEPSAFIDLAETSGLISDLSFRVMQDALQTASGWPGDLKIAVNISRVQFNDPLLSQRILRVLTTTGFPAARLELEIFEKCLLEDSDTALATISSLKNCGISVSIEDFGTGYASVMDLKTLPFDRIKIDRGFLRSLIDGDSCDALVKAVAALGRGLSLPITAEGVESSEIEEKLSELGCTDAQGWLFGEALSAEEVEIGFLRRDSAVTSGPSADPAFAEPPSELRKAC